MSISCSAVDSRTSKRITGGKITTAAMYMCDRFEQTATNASDCFLKAIHMANDMVKGKPKKCKRAGRIRRRCFAMKSSVSILS